MVSFTEFFVSHLRYLTAVLFCYKALKPFITPPTDIMPLLPDESLNTVDSTRVSSIDESVFVSFESDQSPLPKIDENAYLFVVLCPPDGGPWALLTCILGFLALLICDGVCLSFILFDGRLGMVENLPPGTRTFEHLAAIYLLRYLTGMYNNYNNLQSKYFMTCVYFCIMSLFAYTKYTNKFTTILSIFYIHIITRFISYL